MWGEKVFCIRGVLVVGVNQATVASSIASGSKGGNTMSGGGQAKRA